MGKKEEKKQNVPSSCFSAAFSKPQKEAARARDRGLGRYLGTAAGSPVEERAGRGPSEVASWRRGPRGVGLPTPRALCSRTQLGAWAGDPRLGSPPRSWAFRLSRRRALDVGGTFADPPRRQRPGPGTLRASVAPCASPFSRGPVRPVARGQRPGPISCPAFSRGGGVSAALPPAEPGVSREVLIRGF